MIFEHEENVDEPIDGTIIDLETIGEFKDLNDCQRYQDIKPVIYGLLEVNKIEIYYIKTKKDIPELINLIDENIQNLKMPLYAFNCEFERCILSYYLGKTFEFQELQPREKISKEYVCWELGISNFEDPYHGRGILCYQAWLRGEYENCVKYNRACLLKEAEILKTAPNELDLFKKPLWERFPTKS